MPGRSTLLPNGLLHVSVSELFTLLLSNSDDFCVHIRPTILLVFLIIEGKEGAPPTIYTRQVLLGDPRLGNWAKRVGLNMDCVWVGPDPHWELWGGAGGGDLLPTPGQRSRASQATEHMERGPKWKEAAWDPSGLLSLACLFLSTGNIWSLGCPRALRSL